MNSYYESFKFFWLKNFQMMMSSKKMALSTSSSKFQAVERCGNLLERTDFAKEAETSQKLLAVSEKFQGQNMSWNGKKTRYVVTAGFYYLRMNAPFSIHISPVIEHCQTLNSNRPIRKHPKRFEMFEPT